MGTFWNQTRQSRSPKNNNFNDISLESLEKHFQVKVSYDVDTENDFISEARKDVKKKLDNCLKSYDNFIFTENMMRK